jgi:hypothetical protein
MALSDSRDMVAFNLAMPYLQRVNNILNNNYAAFRRGDIGAFANNLRQLFREVRPFLVVRTVKGENVDEVQDIKTLFEELAKIPKKEKEKIWGKMEEIEAHLRQCFNTIGALMPRSGDPRYLFGNKQK